MISGFEDWQENRIGILRLFARRILALWEMDIIQLMSTSLHRNMVFRLWFYSL